MDGASSPFLERSFLSGGCGSFFQPFEMLFALLAFLVAACVYIYTLAPTITFGDSGELITAAYHLGVAHPPGYPLWLLLAKLFSFVPIGTVAYRLNLMSALLNAAALGLLTLVIVKTLPKASARILPSELFDSPVAGMLTGAASAAAALSLGFSPTFWQQSVSAEVYALNNFLICLILLLLAAWGASPDRTGLLFLIVFLFGLGLGNHQTLALMMPAAALYVALVRPKTMVSPQALAGCALFFLAGLSLYLYLPLRAMAHPPLNWGDPVTWDSFWFHVSRKQYRSLGVARPLPVIVGQVKFFFNSTARESLPLALLAPAFITAGFAGKEGRKWLLLTLAGFFCTGVLLVIIANTELDLNAQDLLRIYFLPPWIFVAIWIGYGIAAINLLALRASRRLRRPALAAIFLAALWLFLPLAGLIYNFEESSLRGHDFGRKYGETLLNTMRQGGVLFAGTDSAYAIPMYMKWVHGRRPDISILSVNRLSARSYRAEAERNAPGLEFFSEEDYAEAFSLYAAAPEDSGGVHGAHRVGRVNAFLMLKLYQKNISHRPVYYEQGLPIEWITDFAVPSGLLVELKESRIVSLAPEIVASNKEYWRTLEENLFADPYFVRDNPARQKFSKLRSNIGYLYLRRKMYADAREALEQAIRFSDRNIEAYAFLALVFREQGEREKAIRVFDEYLRRDVWNTSARAFAEALTR